MRAHEGDWLVVDRATIGQEPLRGLITEVRSEDGRPPYLVRWTDDDHTALVFPGPDAHVLTHAEMDEFERNRERRLERFQESVARSRAARRPTVT